MINLRVGDKVYFSVENQSIWSGDLDGIIIFKYKI